MRLTWKQRATIGIMVFLIVIFMGLKTERIDVVHTKLANLTWYGIPISLGEEAITRLGEYKYVLVIATLLVGLTLIFVSKKK